MNAKIKATKITDAVYLHTTNLLIFKAELRKYSIFPT